MTGSGQPGAPPPPGQAPGTPPPADWQSTPQQPAPPPPAAGGGGMPSWTSNITSQAPVAGPAGFVYADVPNRIIAYVIDFIILFIAFFIIGILSISLMGQDLGFGVRVPTTGSQLFATLLSFAISAAYFIYTWVNMRGTPGMKLLGMQVGHQADGRTLTYNQAAIRYGVLFGPYILFNLIGSLALSLGLITSLLGFLWFIVLLVTTAQSPTKQGIHDRYSQSMVVKASRSVG